MKYLDLHAARASRRVHERLPEHVQKLRVIFIGHVVSLRMIGNEVWWKFWEDGP